MTDTTTYSPTNPLLRPYDSAALHLPNRIVMAPMTRGRADAAGVPHPLAAAYYAQRASAGLIVTEGIWPISTGIGGPGLPGLATAAQVAGWRTVTTAVHAAGGRIFAQLWHVGRVSHPSVQPGRAAPLAPSAVRPPGQLHVPGGKADYVTPRAMALAEIAETVRSYADAARNALAAGFDGVEVHAANGYLLQQFLGDNTNLRSDAYADGRRFVIEVVDAVTGAIGAARVGLRLSPGNTENDVHESDPGALYAPLVSTLDSRGLAYLHLSEKGRYPAITELRQVWSGTLIGNYDPPEPTNPATGELLLASGAADLVAFGRLFLANPDLPIRIAVGAPLAEAAEATHYTPGPSGYADYPAIDLVDAYDPINGM
ncbi:alkene reductase [Fodinicola feengrottensis]|uniref:Alkene reductase n=1 Tax=Fodinicola feengrottensis TaxID=435914 RepID=A0ABN2HTR7_9ACTN|nr:alkene reductase [Fodinicola feengrottensis]